MIFIKFNFGKGKIHFFGEELKAFNNIINSCFCFHNLWLVSLKRMIGKGWKKYEKSEFH